MVGADLHGYIGSNMTSEFRPNFPWPKLSAKHEISITAFLFSWSYISVSKSSSIMSKQVVC